MIELRHVTKKYGDHLAIEDLCATLETGRIYGFLGPNGAGKSTTMNIMTGCLAATEGQVLIDGLDIFQDNLRAKRKLGYLPEQPPLYPDMTPEEYLTFVGKAKGISRLELDLEVARVMKETGVSALSQRLIRNLSKGYKQRVGLAQALLGSPEIIILDEPTEGLDPKQRMEMRELIRRLGKEHTVVLSSHILSEVQAVCDCILILSQGKLVAMDEAKVLEEKFSRGVGYDITVKGEEAAAREILQKIPQVRAVECHPGEKAGVVNLSVVTDGEEIDEVLSTALFAGGCPILQMNRRQAALEEIFLELTGEKSSAGDRIGAEEVAPKKKKGGWFHGRGV